MSQENQSCLRFSLEESLWFRKGQEVEELISISLDPDITIQENDQYVTIRGSLQLTGEYKCFETEDADKDGTGSNQKFVERVEKQETGVCEFDHRFPVDITIPNNRIQSIYDIDVLVESFDYSLVERSCLKLSAELTISGLYDVQQQEESAPYEVLSRTEEEELEVFDPKNEDSFLFEAEARKQQEEEDESPVFPQFPSFTYQAKKEEKEEEDSPSWELEEARNEGTHQTEIFVEQEVIVQHVPEEHVHMEEEVIVLEESSSSSEQEPPKQEKKKKAASKKSMTLTEFFARKDESSPQAKLKVCIVQKGDTVNSLAERYDVTIQNLLRVNDLEINQDVYEGQVLYIPATLAKK